MRDERGPDPGGAVTAAVLVMGGMGTIVLGGALALAWLSPEFVAATLGGLTGGESRLAVTLFVIQLVAFVAIAVGFVGVIARGRRRGRGSRLR